MEKLKKVDDLLIQMNKKITALNIAYRSGKGFEVDKANKELFDLVETTALKDSSYHIELKNHTWQQNHLKVLASVSNLMQKLNRLPTNTEISTEAGLSVETIYKHLKEFKDHNLYKHEANKFRLMKDRVLTTVFNLGVQGDIRACKVYLDHFQLNDTPAPALAQTYYIQINNLKITPDELERLPPATLQKIETLIKMPIKLKVKN